jgi:UDPglucose--hexose-1-phosphate uridylyltransferase
MIPAPTAPSVAAVVRLSRRAMADGREIIYYDEPGAAPRVAVDRRELGPRAQAGDLRFDALTGDWVSIAGHRSDRTFLPPADACPLCPTGRGSVPSEVPESDYDVVVFENRFPSFATRTDASQGALGQAAAADMVDRAELHLHRPAAGRCEVVAFTSDHEANIASLPPQRVRTVIEAWAHRTSELSTRAEVEHVFCFENRGVEIGVTLHHPHGQIYAYPDLPARTLGMLTRARQHHESTGRVLGADLLAIERTTGTRMVLEGEHWSAYVPFAARWPVEVHLVPHRDVPDLAALTAAERDELAHIYPELLGRLDRYYPAVAGQPIRMPYIAAWHQAPVRTGREVSRLHLQVFSVLRSPDRLKYLAGSESGAGAWVNDVAPESIARRLREVGS